MGNLFALSLIFVFFCLGDGGSLFIISLRDDLWFFFILTAKLVKESFHCYLFKCYMESSWEHKINIKLRE